MSHVLTTTSRVLTVRYMEPRDLPQVLRIVERTPAPRWARKDILFHFQSSDISSWVAEADQRITGFAISRVIPRNESHSVTTTSPTGNEVQWRADPAAQMLRF